MTIFDDAREGTLTSAKLEKLRLSNSSTLDDQDPRTGWTLLATAVVSGFPDQVELLLTKGAKATVRCRDNETPLLLAAWKTPKERPLILQKLLPYVREESIKSIDYTCDLAENNTPLMCAIENLDADSVRLLAKAGAKLHIKNNDGFNAVQVASNTGKFFVRNALEPEQEQSKLARLASNVVTFMRHVVSWVDKKFNGFMGKVFGFKGERHKSANKTLKAMKLAQDELTSEEFIKNVNTYINEKPMLGTFFKDNPKFIQNMVKKAVDLANDHSTDLGSKEVLPKTIKVTMHQQVIYCDDSTSMGNKKGRAEKRWESQMDLALRIVRTTSRILPDGDGIALRFINNKTTDTSPSLDLEGIEKGLKLVSPNGDTPIGTTLRERILKPLVYEPLAERKLSRPLLVSILTDGGPSGKGEEEGTLAKVIVDCGKELARNEYPKDSVKFLVCQIGSSENAAKFLNILEEARTKNPDIANVLHIFAGRLDDKFKSFRDERKLDRWLIETLFKPLEATAAT